MASQSLIIKILSYFPARLAICGVFYAAVLISHYSDIVVIENQTLVGMLHVFNIPSYLDGKNLYVGTTPYNYINFDYPLHVQLIFLTFFLSFATATSASVEKRLIIVFFAILCLGGYVLIQFFEILIMLKLGVASYQGFLVTNIIITTFVGAACIESCFFLSITRPAAIKIEKRLLKRSYFREFAFFSVMMVMSVLFVYFLATIVDLKGSSIVSAYLAFNITTILALRHYMAYFFIQLKKPDWLKYHNVPSRMREPIMSLTFLLPAYNEQKIIKRTIESIDRAASHYVGKTEILIVNDGSVDATREIASNAVRNLKYASGVVYNIPNSGKGAALDYGLKRATGDVVFRIDTDSIVDEHIIAPVMRHFKDMRVGSVSGNVFPLEDKTIWQKFRELQVFEYIYAKTEQDLIDSINVQPGAFSVFRRIALLEAEGWQEDQFGEDGELTIRLARYGWKHDFEPRATLWTEAPATLEAFREQRIRWGIGYYAARSRNWDLMKELRGPRSFVYLIMMYTHGMGLLHTIFWPFLAVGIVLNFVEPSVGRIYWLADITRIAELHFLLHSMQYTVYLYYIIKLKKYYLIPYVPLMNIYGIVLGGFVLPETINMLLVWSSKWRANNVESYKALRDIIKNRVIFAHAEDTG